MTQVQHTNYTQAEANQLHRGWTAAKRGEAFDCTNGSLWVEGFTLALLQSKGPLAARLALRNGPEASRG